MRVNVDVLGVCAGLAAAKVHTALDGRSLRKSCSATPGCAGTPPLLPLPRSPPPLPRRRLPQLLESCRPGAVREEEGKPGEMLAEVKV